MNRLERGLGIQQPSTRLSRGLGIADPNQAGWDAIGERNTQRNYDQLNSAMNGIRGPRDSWNQTPQMADPITEKITEPGRQQPKTDYQNRLAAMMQGRKTDSAQHMLNNSSWGAPIDYKMLYDSGYGADKKAQYTASGDIAGMYNDFGLNVLKKMGQGGYEGWTPTDRTPTDAQGNPISQTNGNSNGGVSGLDVLNNDYSQTGAGDMIDRSNGRFYTGPDNGQPPNMGYQTGIGTGGVNNVGGPPQTSFTNPGGQPPNMGYQPQTNWQTPDQGYLTPQGSTPSMGGSGVSPGQGFTPGIGGTSSGGTVTGPAGTGSGSSFGDWQTPDQGYLGGGGGGYQTPNQGYLGGGGGFGSTPPGGFGSSYGALNDAMTSQGRGNNRGYSAQPWRNWSTQ